MREKLQMLEARIDALEPRERILVFVSVVAALLFLLQILLLDPLLTDREKVGQQRQQLQGQIENLRAEQELLQMLLAAGVNKARYEKRDQLRSQLAELDQQIQQSVLVMVPPKLMPELLESVLAQSRGLTLLGLENLPVETVASQTVAEGEQAPLSLYRHRFNLRLGGDYHAVTRYFEKLQTLPWRFHWNRMHYEVDAYPRAVITLQVHTLSMSKEWIGV